jgi:hypothetical protein
MRLTTALVAPLALAALGLSCVRHLERTVTPQITTVDHRAAFLKVHLKNGDLFVLSEWRADELHRRVTGTGDQLGADRRLIRRGDHDVAMDDVALYETNAIVTSPSIAAIAVVTGASIALSAVCIASPKTCFGSCPTFYAPAEDTGRPVLQAEGFSDAISPALESHDIDALWRTHATDGRLTLRMTNEAYETHVVKRADLLAVPRPPGTRVVSTGEALWLASAPSPAARCAADEGDCTAALAAVDGRERTSASDERDLAARETIDLEFPVGDAGGRAGIVIAARQSLVTTFLLYQGLSYLGTTAVDWLAALERGDRTSRAGGRALQQLVGGIEVQVPHGAGWQTVGEVHEIGPLATDVHLVPLPDGARGDRVRLRLPRGGWRIDHVARVTLAHQVTPQRIAPRAIRGTLGREFAAGRAPASGLPIVTQPGDAYELDYDLPRGEVELFLDTRGYYLEWMRAEWLREEQPLAVVKLMLDPAQAMRDLAPAWKRLEPQAEQLFWSSRYARP